MRIAILTPGFSRTADDWAIPALQTLVERLAQTHEVTVFSLRYPEQGVYLWPHFNHVAIGGGQNFGVRSLSIWMATVRAVLAAHRQKPFDRLHAFWVDEPALTAVLAAAFIRRPVMASMGGGELVYLPDIGYGTQGSALRRFIIRLALRQANLITAGSTYQLNLARAAGVPDTKLRCAPFGVDTTLFQPGPLPDWHQPTLIQAASLVPVKNQVLLLEVLARVKTDLPAIQLILAGGGPLENELRARAEQLGVAQQIIWQAKTAYQDMPALFRQAHLYVQTSRHESLGMAVLEGMACGVPVVGTPVGVLPQVACCPATNEAGTLAAQVIEVFGEQTRYLAHRQVAIEAVTSRFSLDAAAAAFNRLYDEVGSV